MLHNSFFVLTCLLVSVAAGHQIPLESPPQSELAKTQPPLWGSSAFLKTAPTYLRHRCTGEQHAQLDDIERRLSQASHIRQGADGVSQRVAEYQRWKAETGLVELLSSLPGVLHIDALQSKPSAESGDQVNLNRQSPSILLEIYTGEGPTEFFVADWNLQREAHPEDFEVVVADHGTTFALLRLTGPPAEENRERFSIRRRSDPDPFRWHGVKWSVAPLGNLSLSIQDENGKPTPAILRLRSTTDGSLWEPHDAIDMRPQLNNVVSEGFVDFGPGQGYTFFLPGEQRGRYWIVKPECEFPIPEGEWEMRIQRGTEYLPVVDTLKVRAGDWTTKTVRLNRWTNMPEQGWWSGDDHVHARLMSKADADRLLTYCQAVDLHMANILEMGDVARSYYAQRGFGRDFRVERGNYWLIPGQEDPRSVLGHAIGLNLKQRVRDVDQYLQNDVLAKQIHQQGGLYGHTHMGAKACFVEREMALFTPLGIVDFNSIMQAALGTGLYYDMLNLGFKMTASAGADTPYGGTIGAVRVYAYTGDNNKLDPDAWFDALKQGRTFVTNGPMLDFTVDDRMPGDTIDLSAADVVQVHARATGSRLGSAPKVLRIVCCGDVVAEVTSGDSEQVELGIDQELPTGAGGWIAVHAIGHDGSEAHTTPVYVSVDGQRHWAKDKAANLLQQKFAILDDIEAAMAESEDLVERHNDPLDYWNQVNSAQADAVRLQVAKVRKLYQELAAELQESPATAKSR